MVFMKRQFVSANLINRITYLFITMCVFFSPVSRAQMLSSMRDSLDGKLDMSDWVLDAHGFIPIPVLITEPALGGIGGALIPVFITRNAPYVDTVGNQVITERVRPNIYALGGAYTANGTWLGAGAAMGVIRSWRANYRLASGFANVNMEFYHDLSDGETRSFEFNIQALPVYGQLIKQLWRGSNWYAGLNYLFLKTELKRTNAEFHTPDEVKADISRLGVLVEFDKRDNIFTPNRGFRWNTQVSRSDDWLGSDYNYTQASSAAFAWLPVASRFTAGFRAEYQEVWGDEPFYLMPFINMRGIPVARYQGEITTLAETEWRYDFKVRWSVLAFGGAGKAMGEWSEFSDADWRASGGAGFRYLIARKLKLRMGVDIAHGPEDFAYYVVFGTSWVK